MPKGSWILVQSRSPRTATEETVVLVVDLAKSKATVCGVSTRSGISGVVVFALVVEIHALFAG